ncbi:unnamed protein product [Coffea canephora]|uniref:RING-type E3 ubiquitin transferase n=1 Tax=Coffea canephora TaxID=49390 RepID=A0A068VBC2_COFCA|nr:unnamed protein product [Coffea canephora]
MVQVSNRGDEDQQQLLPVDGDGTCMACKKTPELDRTVTCGTCNTPWHVDCLVEGPTTLVEILSFICPDCSGGGLTGAPAPVSSSNGDLVTKIRAIEADGSLTEREKAKKRQELFAGKGVDKDEQKRKGKEKMNEALALLSQSIKCSFCMQLPERPVTNCLVSLILTSFFVQCEGFTWDCLKLFLVISVQFINVELYINVNRKKIRTMKIRNSFGSFINKGHWLFIELYSLLNILVLPNLVYGSPSTYFRLRSKLVINSPHLLFSIVTYIEKSFKHSKGPSDCFITPCHPLRRSGSIYCDPSEVVMEKFSSSCYFSFIVSPMHMCRLFGGRDLSGNKRTNKDQSFDQEFKNFNEALRVSCKKGYPVRVISGGLDIILIVAFDELLSHQNLKVISNDSKIGATSCLKAQLGSYKEKRSSYAPEKDLRYDGIYRIEKCWRKVGQQGFKVCRYLFVRCDNEPAPWTSDEDGDCPRALPDVPELQQAIDIFERRESPSWDYDDGETCWKWKMPPPPSKEKVIEAKPEDIERARRAFKKSRHDSLRENLLKEFSCLLCKKVMNLPVTTPCAHNFCKSCLEDCFSGQAFIRERTCKGGRQLRAQKNCMKCPVCPSDISEFLQNMQVNREVMTAIEDIQAKLEEDEKTMEDSGEHGVDAEQESPGDQPSDTEIASLNAEDVGSNGSALKRKSVDGCLSTENKRQKADNGHGISDETENVHADANGSPSSPLHLRPNDEIFS